MVKLVICLLYPNYLDKIISSHEIRISESHGERRMNRKCKLYIDITGCPFIFDNILLKNSMLMHEPKQKAKYIIVLLPLATLFLLMQMTNLKIENTFKIRAAKVCLQFPRQHH